MIRYPYKGEGARGFNRMGHSHPPHQLIDFYRSMLRIRRIEEEIERRYHQDQMKTPIHLVIGQEAAAVGCCSALRQTDLVYTSHRTHGAYLAKGGDLRRMLCEMHCRINGCAGSRGGSMHLIDKSVGMAGTSAIVGGAVPIATGAALAAQMKREDRVVVVFIGDATTEEGVTSESLNFAALKKLLSTRVPKGENLVVSSHANPFYALAGPPYLAEGEMAVIQPKDESFTVVTRRFDSAASSTIGSSNEPSGARRCRCRAVSVDRSIAVSREGCLSVATVGPTGAGGL